MSCWIELRRPSDGQCSERRPFDYTPLEAGTPGWLRQQARRKIRYDVFQSIMDVEMRTSCASLDKDMMSSLSFSSDTEDQKSINNNFSETGSCNLNNIQMDSSEINSNNTEINNKAVSTIKMSFPEKQLNIRSNTQPPKLPVKTRVDNTTGSLKSKFAILNTTISPPDEINANLSKLEGETLSRADSTETLNDLLSQCGGNNIYSDMSVASSDSSDSNKSVDTIQKVDAVISDDMDIGEYCDLSISKMSNKMWNNVLKATDLYNKPPNRPPPLPPPLPPKRSKKTLKRPHSIENLSEDCYETYISNLPTDVDIVPTDKFLIDLPSFDLASVKRNNRSNKASFSERIKSQVMENVVFYRGKMMDRNEVNRCLAQSQPNLTVVTTDLPSNNINISPTKTLPLKPDLPEKSKPPLPPPSSKTPNSPPKLLNELITENSDNKIIKNSIKNESCGDEGDQYAGFTIPLATTSQFEDTEPLRFDIYAQPLKKQNKLKLNINSSVPPVPITSPHALDTPEIRELEKGLIYDDDTLYSGFNVPLATASEFDDTESIYAGFMKFPDNPTLPEEESSL